MSSVSCPKNPVTFEHIWEQINSPDVWDEVWLFVEGHTIKWLFYPKSARMECLALIKIENNTEYWNIVGAQGPIFEASTKVLIKSLLCPELQCYGV